MDSLAGRASSATSRYVDGRTTRWSGQKDGRRAEFVEAALLAIAHHGPQTSTEQIANYVGVTRTKLYRYFDGAADLHHSIARRVGDMLVAAQRPTRNPTSRPMEIITQAVSKHLRWRADNANLYGYLTCHSLSDDENGVAAIREVNNAVATNVSGVLRGYFRAVGLNEDSVAPLSFGLVGMVDSAATHWLNDSAPLPLAEFVAQLADWTWALLSDTLRSCGVMVDPHQPMALQ